MTWKGLQPMVALSHKVYQKGISLDKKAMQAVEARLKRYPELPQWDILIRPISTAGLRMFFLRNRPISKH
jgi:hypothetical protein